MYILFVLVSCDCCGVKLLEIKCPFCKKMQVLDSSDTKFYLKKNSDTGELKLDPEHMYQYQIQTQALGPLEDHSYL